MAQGKRKALIRVALLVVAVALIVIGVAQGRHRWSLPRRLRFVLNV